jgi:raffinose/stachyose/melibiose transport system substrate-binding protein
MIVKKHFRFYGALILVLMLGVVSFGCSNGKTTQDTSGTQAPVGTTANTAATQSSTAANPVELTFMGWQPDLVKLNEMNPMVSEKYPNIKIKPQVLDWFAYWDKLTVDMAAGAGPDIMAIDVDHIPTYYDYIEPLDTLANDVIGSDWKSKWNDGVIDSLKVVDDKTMMLPSDVTGLWYLFYNKSLIDELHVAPPTGDYADLTRFVNQINAAGKDILPVAFAGKEDVNVGFLWSWLASNNQPGIVKDAASGKAKFTDAPFVTAFDQLKKMMADKVIDEKTFGLDAYPGADNIFKNRKTAAYLTGQWSVGGYLMGSQVKGTPVEKDDLGVVALKNISGKDTVMQKYASLGYAINKNSKHKKEAMQVIQEWTTGKAAQTWISYQGTVPAAKSVTLDPNLMKTAEAKKTVPAALDALNTNKSVLRSTLNSALDNKIGETVVSVLRKGMSVPDALKQIQQTADSSN